MICPHTTQECRNGCLPAGCQLSAPLMIGGNGKWTVTWPNGANIAGSGGGGGGLNPPAGVGSFPAILKHVTDFAPPQPSLAEIERLVDVFGEAVQSLCHFDECGTGYGRPELEVERDAARADLIDFARRMGVE